MIMPTTIIAFVLISAPWTVSASLDEALAGLSMPDLSNIIQDLDLARYNEFSESPDYSMLQYPDQKIDERAESVFRPITGKPLFERPKGPAGLKENKVKAESNPAAAILPSYCDPPNPCPLGYTSKDGCIEDFENSSDFSRMYQSRQKCICDTEHMFNCPDGNVETPNHLEHSSSLEQLGFANPYLTGQKLPVAAKKGMDF